MDIGVVDNDCIGTNWWDWLLVGADSWSEGVEITLCILPLEDVPAVGFPNDIFFLAPPIGNGGVLEGSDSWCGGLKIYQLNVYFV